MRLLVAVLTAAALLAACAHPWNAVNLPAGTPRDQVVARAGQPTRVVELPGGGQRLQYSGQPFGQYAIMADLDAGGRLLRARQVLTEADFNRIELDKWTRADIDREFGRPAQVDGVASWNGPIYTYRWQGQGDMFYWVYFDPQGVVRRAHPGIEHKNTPDAERVGR